MKAKRIILASKSSTRKQRLQMSGFDPIVIVSLCDESTVQENNPEKLVGILSRMKAEAVSGECETGDLIIAADTIVSLDDKILGKPKTKKEAFEMIKSISGRKHNVFTGVTLIYKKKDGDAVDTFVEKTPVKVAEMTNCEIHAYVDSGEPMDKAGGYGIQGIFGKYIPAVEGDAFSVAGLPMARTYQHMKNIQGLVKHREVYVKNA